MKLVKGISLVAGKPATQFISASAGRTENKGVTKYAWTRRNKPALSFGCKKGNDQRLHTSIRCLTIDSIHSSLQLTQLVGSPLGHLKVLAIFASIFCKRSI